MQFDQLKLILNTAKTKVTKARNRSLALFLSNCLNLKRFGISRHSKNLITRLKIYKGQLISFRDCLTFKKKSLYLNLNSQRYFRFTVNYKFLHKNQKKLGMKFILDALYRNGILLPNCSDLL